MGFGGGERFLRNFFFVGGACISVALFRPTPPVIPGLDPGIHGHPLAPHSPTQRQRRSVDAGSSPGMTAERDGILQVMNHCCPAIALSATSASRQKQTFPSASLNVRYGAGCGLSALRHRIVKADIGQSTGAKV